MSKVFANLSSEKKILGVHRKIALYVNKPTPADAFVPWNDKLNLKLRVQISADEKEHSRPSLRIRRKLSTIFTTNYPFVSSEYCTCSTITGEHYLEAIFHCHDDKAGEEMYNRLAKEFFSK